MSTRYPGNSARRSGEGTAMPDQDPKSRAEKSLAELTKRFLRLLQESEGGILDLKKVNARMSFHH